MSPITGPFLVAVFFIWLIPIVWALFFALHLKALRNGIRPWLAELIHCEHPDLLGVTDQQIKLEIKYQNLQTELVSVRQKLARSIERQKDLGARVTRISNELEQAERLATSSTATHGDWSFVVTKREELQRLKQELSLLSVHVESLRERLTQMEVSVQKAYTYKQIHIARSKADEATDVAKKLLSIDRGAAYSTIRRMEEKVVRAEAKIYGPFFS